VAIRGDREREGDYDHWGGGVSPVRHTIPLGIVIFLVLRISPLFGKKIFY